MLAKQSYQELSRRLSRLVRSLLRHVQLSFLLELVRNEGFSTDSSSEDLGKYF